MLKLWKNCDLYAPAHLGKQDILVLGGKFGRLVPTCPHGKPFRKSKFLIWAVRSFAPA